MEIINYRIYFVLGSPDKPVLIAEAETLMRLALFL